MDCISTPGKHIITLMTERREFNEIEGFFGAESKFASSVTRKATEVRSECAFIPDDYFPIDNIVNQGSDLIAVKPIIEGSLHYSQEERLPNENEASTTSLITNPECPTYDHQSSDVLLPNVPINESLTSGQTSRGRDDWFTNTPILSECNTTPVTTVEKNVDSVISLPFNPNDSPCLSSTREAENDDSASVRVRSCGDYSSPNDVDTDMRESPYQDGSTKNILSHAPLQSSSMHACERCGKQYRHAASLKNHCRKHDSGELASKKFKCPFCVYSSQYNRNVTKHVEATHQFCAPFGSTQHSAPLNGHDAVKDHTCQQSASNFHPMSKKEFIRRSAHRTHEFPMQNQDPLSCGIVHNNSPYINTIQSGFGANTVPSIYSFVPRNAYKCGFSEGDDGASSINQKDSFPIKNMSRVSPQNTGVQNGVNRNGLEMDSRSGNALQRLLDVKCTNIAQLEKRTYGSNVANCDGPPHCGVPISRTSEFDIKTMKQTQILDPTTSQENGCQYMNISYASTDVYSFPSSTSNCPTVYHHEQATENNSAVDMVAFRPEVNSVGQNRHGNYYTTEKNTTVLLNTENQNVNPTQQQSLHSFSLKHQNSNTGELHYSSGVSRSIVECGSYDADGSTSLSATLVGEESVESYKKGSLGSAVEQLLCASNDVVGYEIGEDDVKENNPFSSTPTIRDHESEGCTGMSEFQSVLHQQVTSETDAFLSDLQEILSRDMPQLDKVVPGGPVDGDYSTESTEFSESNGSGINSNQTLSAFSVFSGDSGIENMSSSSSCSAGGSVTNSVWGIGAQDISVLPIMKSGSPITHPSTSLCSSMTATNSVGTFASTPDDNQVRKLCNGAPSIAQSSSSVADTVKNYSPNVQAGYPRVALPSSHKQPEPVDLPDFSGCNGKAQYAHSECAQSMQGSKTPFDAAYSIEVSQRRDPSRLIASSGEYISQQPSCNDPAARWRPNRCFFRPGFDPCCQQQTESSLHPSTLRDSYGSYHHQRQQRNFYHPDFSNPSSRPYYEHASVTSGVGATGAPAPTVAYDLGPDHSSPCIQPVNSAPYGSVHCAMKIDQTPPELGYFNSSGGAVYRPPMIATNADYLQTVHHRQQQQKAMELGSSNYQGVPVSASNRSVGQPPIPNGSLPGRDEYYSQFHDQNKPQHPAQLLHGYGNSGVINHTSFENTRRVRVPPAQMNQVYPSTEGHKYYQSTGNKPLTSSFHPAGYEQSNPVSYHAGVYAPSAAAASAVATGVQQAAPDLIPGYASGGGHFPHPYQQVQHHPQAAPTYSAPPQNAPPFSFTDMVNYHRLQEVPRGQEVIRPALNDWPTPNNGAVAGPNSLSVEGMIGLGYEPGLLPAPPHRSDANQQMTVTTTALPVGQSPL